MSTLKPVVVRELTAAVLTESQQFCVCLVTCHMSHMTRAVSVTTVCRISVLEEVAMKS